MKKVMIVILVVLLAALLALGALNFYVKGHIMDGPGMVNHSALHSVSYTAAGGMLGGHYRLELTVDENDPEKVTVELSEQEAWNTDEHVTVKTVDHDCCFAVEDIITRSDMRSWADCPPAETITLDADTTTVSICYEDGATYRFSDTQELPDGAWDEIRALRDCILNAAEIAEEK